MTFLQKAHTFFVVHGDRIAMGWFIFGVIGSILFGVGWLIFGPPGVYDGTGGPPCQYGRAEMPCR